MSDLDDKLKKIKVPVYLAGQGTYGEPLTEENIAQIKQAFADAGYRQEQQLVDIIAQQGIELKRLQMTPAPTYRMVGKVDYNPEGTPIERVMTGQEWYDKFEKEYNYLATEPFRGYSREIGQMITDRAQKAAKKAAGLE